MDLQALALTLRLAALTTLLLLVLSIPLALWIAARDTWPRRLVQAAGLLPLLLPPTVLGFYLLELFGSASGPGRLLARLLGGHTLAFSFAGLLVGSVIYSLPFALQPLVTGFRAVDPELTGIARSLGASPLQVASRVTLPLSWPAFGTAAILTFCHTVGEFGVVLMLGGDIPGSTRTLSISLFDLVQEANYTAANRTALLLVALSLATLLLTQLRRSSLGERAQ